MEITYKNYKEFKLELITPFANHEIDLTFLDAEAFYSQMDIDNGQLGACNYLDRSISIKLFSFDSMNQSSMSVRDCDHFVVDINRTMEHVAHELGHFLDLDNSNEHTSDEWTSYVCRMYERWSVNNRHVVVKFLKEALDEAGIKWKEVGND